MNSTKATFLRDVELQNLTPQNVFTKTETDDRYVLKTAVYTKTESDARYAQIGAGGDDNESAYTRNESDFLYARRIDVYDKTQIDGMHYRKDEVYNKTELYTATEVDTLFVSNTSRLNTLKNDADVNKTAIATLTAQDAVLTELNDLKLVAQGNQTAIANLQVQDTSLSNQTQASYLGYFDITNNRLPALTSTVNSNITAIANITSINVMQTNTINSHITAVAN